MSEVAVRPATSADVARIAAIHSSAWRAAFTFPPARLLDRVPEVARITRARESAVAQPPCRTDQRVASVLDLAIGDTGGQASPGASRVDVSGGLSRVPMIHGSLVVVWER
jgi:hypothetical protein